MVGLKRNAVLKQAKVHKATNYELRITNSEFLVYLIEKESAYVKSLNMKFFEAN